MHIFPLSFFLGLRLLRTPRRQRFLSLVAVLCFGALALGTALLIVVLSVMNGFEQEIQRRILVGLPHMELHVREDQSMAAIKNWRALARRIEAVPGVLAATPNVRGEVLLFGSGGRMQGIELQGILPEIQDQPTSPADQKGAALSPVLHPGSWDIVLGITLARALGVRPGGQVQVLSAEALSTPFGIMPRMRTLTVIGLSDRGGAQGNTSLAQIHLQDARKLFRVAGEANSMQLRLADLEKIPQILEKLKQEFGDCCTVRSWRERHASLFHALRMEKIVVSSLLSFVILIALFSLSVTLRVLVSEQNRSTAMLSILGAPPAMLVGIFIVQGFVIVLAGIFLGVLVGVALAPHTGIVLQFWAQLSGATLFSPHIYYMSLLPTRLLSSDVYMVAATAFCFSLPAVILPALRAVQIRPSTLLRHG